MNFEQALFISINGGVTVLDGVIACRTGELHLSDNWARCVVGKYPAIQHVLSLRTYTVHRIIASTFKREEYSPRHPYVLHANDKFQ